MVKPDGVGRALVGQVIRRLEDKGLRLTGMKLLQVSEALAAKHYAAHVGKPFYAGLVRFITSGPSVAMVFSGPGAIAVVRNLLGATNPAQAAPGTIRGDLGLTIDFNVVHGSDSPEAAEQEIALYFDESELVGIARPDEAWIFPAP